MAHQAVVQESDGSFWIENQRSGDAGESKGLSLGGILGIVGGVVAVGGVTAFLLIRRKRKKGVPVQE